jgi:hypothetical protein
MDLEGETLPGLNPPLPPRWGRRLRNISTALYNALRTRAGLRPPMDRGGRFPGSLRRVVQGHLCLPPFGYAGGRVRLPPLFRIPDRRVSLLSGGLRPARRSAKDPRTSAREGQEYSMSEPRPRQKQWPDQPRRAPGSGHRTGPFLWRMLRLPSARSLHDSRLRAQLRAARSSHARRRAVRAIVGVSGHIEAGAGATAEAASSRVRRGVGERLSNRRKDLRTGRLERIVSLCWGSSFGVSPEQ